MSSALQISDDILHFLQVKSAESSPLNDYDNHGDDEGLEQDG